MAVQDLPAQAAESAVAAAVRRAAVVDRDADEAASILFASGATGEPRGAPGKARKRPIDRTALRTLKSEADTHAQARAAQRARGG